MTIKDCIEKGFSKFQVETKNFGIRYLVLKSVKDNQALVINTTTMNDIYVPLTREVVGLSDQEYYQLTPKNDGR